MEPQLPHPRNLEQPHESGQVESQAEHSSLQPVPEKNLLNPEIQPSSAQDTATASDQVNQIAVSGIAPVIPGQPANDQTNPSVAGDDDVIEKEWVDRAKAVVSKTKEDPRQQKSEVNLLQADYLEKRYNKKIKVNEPNNK